MNLLDSRLQALAFWQPQGPWVNLPRDRQRSESGQPVVAHCDVQIPWKIVNRLSCLSGEQAVSLPTILLAAFQLLLSRYAGQRDLVVAYLGEPLRDMALPVRAVVADDASFRDLLRQVEANLCELVAHRDLPPSLWSDLQPPGDTPGRPRHLPVAFCVASEADGDVNSTSSFDRLENAGVSTDLNLVIRLANAKLAARFVYNADTYLPASIQWMSRHYEQLLAYAARYPDARLDDLAMSTADERQLLERWSYGDPGSPDSPLYHELFHALAEQKPEAAVVVFEGGQLTYRELERRANQLAHHLQELGAGPNIVVSVLMESSPELVIAILAVLKAGAAVLVLAPSFPPSRLATLMHLAAPAVLVTRKRSGDFLKEANWRLVCLDESDRRLAELPATLPPHRATEKDAAFLLVTSGSTGQPKIVVEPYGCLRRQSPFAADDRCVLKANSGTTFSISEVMAVVRGGMLFIAPDGSESDMHRLAAFVGEHGITCLVLVPSALEALLSLDDLTCCDTLRTVHCSGEPISPTLTRRFHERLRSRLVLSYGCTEARSATIRYCAADDDPRIVDAGRPTAMMEVFVLDAQRRPTPIGVPGEIFLGGRIAVGYLNDPAATAERFVPHPFRRTEGVRLFRTGDVGRWMPTGDLAILGRYDDQVKIRGFRVELGEIEATLAQHPDLRQNAVVAREDTVGKKRLVAYLVPRDKQGFSLSAIRRQLREKLPAYMMPSAFVTLDALPLTLNGKVDRRALPAPDEHRPELDTPYVAPRDEVEEQLAAIWAEVLRVERVGVHDSFFDLGGHSLLAMQVVARIHQVCRVLIPLRRMFGSPTVASLAPAVRELQDTAAAMDRKPIGRLSREPRSRG